MLAFSSTIATERPARSDVRRAGFGGALVLEDAREREDLARFGEGEIGEGEEVALGHGHVTRA